MKIYLAIVAAFAYVAVLANAEEPAIKDAAATEADPAQLDPEADAAAPGNQEYFRVDTPAPVAAPMTPYAAPAAAPMAPADVPTVMTPTSS
ncbi:hypothetical protein AM587_10016525 [Phytophthora nicotianae]|uniref:Uncharacterized protein n=1 Tax=Phytophthora nicotianae TaxID=4792 RepID=A0A0W8CB91_PHYNI|nr:hypothetical protein AM587_10016525 [Phytophthora nicotianae]